MGLKKASKVSAEFNMSSLTDIIFLLLIFFMLTSSMVVPNALNLQLPGKKSSTPTTKTTPSAVNISAENTFTLNGSNVSLGQLERDLSALKKRQGKDAVITINPAGKASNESVVAVMDIAYRYELKAVLNDPQ